MSLSSTLSIAAAGLANVTTQMAVISNNVANAATPDFAQEVGTQTSLTAGGVGFGVFTGPVIREIDLQLQTEAFHQNAAVAALQTRQTALQAVDAAQGTPGQGADLGSMLGALQNSFTSLQSDPASSTAQSQVINAAAAVAAQVNTLSRAYTTARQNAQDGLQSGLSSLNTSIATISNLTDQIITAKNSGQSTADLENQRDTAMHAMSQLIDVSFIQQPNGGLLAATAGGLALPMTTPPMQFTMAQSAATEQTYYPGGGIQGVMLNGADVTRQLVGGQIGANITLRDQTLPTYQGELDEFANTLNSRISSQGLQLFTPPSGSAAAAPPQSAYIGYAAGIAVNPAAQANPAVVRDGDLTVAGSASGASAFTPNPTGGPAGFEGLIGRVLTFAFGTQAQAGVAQPPPLVTGLGPLGSLAAPFSVPSDLASFATDVVATQSADVGNTTTQLATATAVQTALQARVTSTSGVNTDAELSSMVALQNSYGANARVVQAVQTMWTQLLASIPAV